MKRNLFLFLVLVFLPALFNTCEKIDLPQADGTLELGAYLNDQSDNLKAALDDSTAVKIHYVVVTVRNANGEIVLNDERLELYNFSGYWVTKELKLKVGTYELIKFLVVDPLGNVRFAAPIDGSPKAYLVKDPLPVKFNIEKDQVTKVAPEVLAVINEPPEEFGYVVFSYSVVKPLDFYMGVYIDNPLIMAPFPLYTDARLNVIIDSIWRHAFYLEPAINRVTVRSENSIYWLVIEKEGYDPIRLKKTKEELLKYTRENPLLVPLPYYNGLSIILQPGPEEGKDAMISKSLPAENFGKWLYFEASNWPDWTSAWQHKLTRSLIQFDLNKIPKSATVTKVMLTLYYAPPVFIDSTIIIDSIYRINADGTINANGVDIKYAAAFQRILSVWEEHEVTWEKQPETTTENQVYLPLKLYITNAEFAPPVSETVDVTRLILDMMKNGNYGMMMRLVEEEYPHSFMFASSDFEKARIWPRLEIFYTLPD